MARSPSRRRWYHYPKTRQNASKCDRLRKRRDLLSCCQQRLSEPIVKRWLTLPSWTSWVRIPSPAFLTECQQRAYKIAAIRHLSELRQIQFQDSRKEAGSRWGRSRRWAFERGIKLCEWAPHVQWSSVLPTGRAQRRWSHQVESRNVRQDDLSGGPGCSGDAERPLSFSCFLLRGARFGTRCFPRESTLVTTSVSHRSGYTNRFGPGKSRAEV